MSPVANFLWNRLSKSLWITTLVLLVGSILIQRNINEFLFSFLLIPFFFVSAKCIYNATVHSQRVLYIKVIFWGSLLVKICAVFAMNAILEFYNDMPFLSYNDDFIYNGSAVELYNRWKVSGFGFYDDIQHGSGTYSGFPIFSALMMNVFGVSHLTPRIGNAILSSFTSIIAYKIVREYCSEENARLVGVLFMLSPLLTIFSAMQFKDTLLLFFSMLAVLSVVRILNRKQVIKSIVLLTLSVGGISLGRPAAIVPIVGAYLVVLLYRFLNKKNHGIIPQLVVLVFVFWGLFKVWGALSMLGVADYGDYFESRYLNLSQSDIMNTEAGITRLSLSALAGAPMYVLFGLFLPPPLLISWDSLDYAINYSAWACVYHTAIIPFLVVSMINIFRKRKESAVPLYLLITFILFKIGQAESVMSIFSPRQSLSTMMVMYLCLPMYDAGDEKMEKWMLGLAIVVALSYSLIRAISHGIL